MTSTSSYLGRAGGDSDWVDARFERAVDIVQSLPRSGPIQTSYDDKLLLYSVYKQATEGDVKTSRPGMLDVLGRAKWDAWNKRKGVSEDEGKRLYVESLVKILRGFSDRPQAVAHIRELEQFSLDPRQMVTSGSTAQTTDDDSSSSTDDDRRRPRPQPGPSSRPYRNRDESNRSQRSRAPPPPSRGTASIAPSLPGYGPPRTGADSPVDNRSGGSSDYTSDEGDRRHPNPAPQRFATPGGMAPSQDQLYQLQQQQAQQYQLQQRIAQLQNSHPPPPPSQGGSQYPYQSYPSSSSAPPNRLLSPNLPPQSQSAMSQSQPFPSFAPGPYPPPPSSFRGALSPEPPQQAVAMMHHPTAIRPLQSAPTPPPAPASHSRSVSAAPGLDQALDRIQTSLSALHERLADLERTKVAASTSDSPLSLLRTSFMQILVLLHLRQPTIVRSNIRLSSLFLRLIQSLIKVGRRVVGDVGVVLLVIGVLGKLRGGEGLGPLVRAVMGVGKREVRDR